MTAIAISGKPKKYKCKPFTRMEKLRDKVIREETLKEAEKAIDKLFRYRNYILASVSKQDCREAIRGLI